MSKGVFWLFAPVLAVAWLQSCGAVTLEPVAPEEPLPAPPPHRGPRLVRFDAGDDANSALTPAE